MLSSKKWLAVDRPLKILHLFDFYLPETMNWAFQMMRHTPTVEQWVAAPWIVHNAYFDEGFKFYVRNIQRLPGLLPDSEWAANWLSSNLIRLETRWPLYQNWLIKKLRDDPPDVLHAHFGPVGCRYLGLAEKLGIPLVVSFYGYDFQRVPFEKPTYQARYQQLFAQANAITTTGPYTPKLLEAQGCSSAKITPLPLSIFPAHFPWFSRQKTPGRLNLVQVATITEKKGHLDTLEAVRQALQTCPNLHLTIAGEQQDKFLVKKMDNFIKINRLERHVALLQPQSHESLSVFFRQFDAFIHPSCSTNLRDREGSPVVILEAQATGLPVLATFHADIPAQVLHGVTGLLSPEKSPDALAKNVERFYWMENDDYQGFSKAAHHHVTQHFDVEQNAVQLGKLYSAVLKGFGTT